MGWWAKMGAMATTETIEVRFEPRDQAADRYPVVPFSVAGAGAIEVTLAYGPERAVIDLGCADPERFRGWSGGARNRYAITVEQATPGYEPGPLPDGTWTVVLGLHRVPSVGVDVTLTITVHDADDVPAGLIEADALAEPNLSAARGSARELPAPDGLRWYAGDFHSHTTHSDGALSIDELAALAAGAGLDFLAVTDHNTVSHHPHLAAAGERHGITLLPGQEITTDRGHANAFGDIGWIDFRQPADRWVQEVRERGGILSINHPLEGDCSWQHPLVELPDALELWHIGWFRDLGSTAPWAFWPRWRPDAILLGGSDFHNHELPFVPGTPTTWVAATGPSVDELFDGVRAGRTAITMPGPDAAALVRVDEGRLVAVQAAGMVLVDATGRRMVIEGDRQEVGTDGLIGPFRLERASGGLLAISPGDQPT